ncbi:hypothetical protein BD413DRAFT_150275 [Trametes elegans]|nr:hypothetical protein BD413DRAFT_150275 [Trametes elegans]
MIAIYAMLVIRATLFFMRREPRPTRVSIIACAGVQIMFILALVLWIIDIYNLVSEIKKTLLRLNPSRPLADSYSTAHSEILRLAAVEDALYAYMTNLGDTFVIWRVYALWSTSRAWRTVLALPLVLLLCSFAMSITLTYCTVRQSGHIVLNTFRHPAFCRDIQTASYAVTLATTGVATILVAYKAWEYQRIYRKAFGKHSRHTRVQWVMMMLVESGILYMLFFLVQVVKSLDPVVKGIDEHSAVAFGLTVYDFSTSVIVGMYPTIIFVFVHSNHSVLRQDLEESPVHRAGASTKRGTIGTRRAYSGTALGGPSWASSRGSVLTAVSSYEMMRFPSSGRDGVLDNT